MGTLARYCMGQAPGADAVKKKNPFQIEGRFVAKTVELLNSPALRVLHPLGHKALHGYEAALGTQRNGDIHVPRNLLMEWMLYKSARGLLTPLQQIHILGFVRPTGRRTIRLTYVNLDVPPTNDWTKFKTVEQALEAIGEKPRRPQTPEFIDKLHTGAWPRGKPWP